MKETDYTIEPIGFVRSTLMDPETAPRQGSDDAPDAWIELAAPMAPGLLGTKAGDELLVFTWLHLADRGVLQVYPRRTPELTGVFATRSPDRPNPIGLHRVTVLEVAGNRLRVAPMEAIDGTPVVDIKCTLKSTSER